MGNAVDLKGSSLTRASCLMLQEMYEAVPIALAPVLGNPVSLASAGINRSAPLQEQVQFRGRLAVHISC